MAESSGTARVVRTAVGVVVLAAVAVAAVIWVLPYVTAGPKRAAQQFLAAVARQDLEAARELMTSETRATEASNLERVVAQGSTYTIDEVNQRGNFATVEFTAENGTSGQVMLQQRNGKWQVYGDGQGPFMAPEDDAPGGGGQN